MVCRRTRDGLARLIRSRHSALVIVAGFGLRAIGRSRHRTRSRYPAHGSPWLPRSQRMLRAATGARQSIRRRLGWPCRRTAPTGLAVDTSISAPPWQGLRLVAVTLRARSWQWCALVFVFSGSANLSGSRFPVRGRVRRRHCGPRSPARRQVGHHLVRRACKPSSFDVHPLLDPRYRERSRSCWLPSEWSVRGVAIHMERLPRSPRLRVGASRFPRRDSGPINSRRS